MPSRLASRGQRRDLGHGEDAALAAPGLLVQGGERRIGGDQPAFGIEPAADAVDVRRAAHARSPDGRARVETRATAAR